MSTDPQEREPDEVGGTFRFRAGILTTIRKGTATRLGLRRRSRAGQPVTWPATRRTLSNSPHYDSEAGWHETTVTQWIGAHGGHVASWVTTDPDVRVLVRPIPSGVELVTSDGRTVAAEWGPDWF